MGEQFEQTRAEAEFALRDGIGAEAKGYKLKCLTEFGSEFRDHDQDVIAYKDAADIVYLLIDNTSRAHQPAAKAVFMLEMALLITKALRTMAIPIDSPSPSMTYWGAKDRGPFVAYRFKVVEPGVSTNYG